MESMDNVSMELMTNERITLEAVGILQPLLYLRSRSIQKHLSPLKGGNLPIFTFPGRADDLILFDYGMHPGNHR